MTIIEDYLYIWQWYTIRSVCLYSYIHVTYAWKILFFFLVEDGIPPNATLHFNYVLLDVWNDTDTIKVFCHHIHLLSCSFKTWLDIPLHLKEKNATFIKPTSILLKSSSFDPGDNHLFAWKLWSQNCGFRLCALSLQCNSAERQVCSLKVKE